MKLLMINYRTIRVHAPAVHACGTRPMGIPRSIAAGWRHGSMSRGLLGAARHPPALIHIK
ncbi:hypothetical protein [Variovorax sp. WDL1]|uniref:hypothetical protein n=1 Tax=Variovorax sp. WDL1 TaxID=207745 RepID=UPI001E5F3C8C|nr:hypothetical protein [Variovorax sp. WDL1]